MMSRPHLLRRFAGDQRGVAAVEMALVGTLMAGALVNVAEVSRYAYMSSQVSAATQAGAQAAIITCEPGATPITTNCPAAAAAINAAIHGSSLGAHVALQGALTEGWYCVTPTSTLQFMVAASGTKPGDCSAAGVPTGKPSLYLRVRTTYTYQPIFPGLTITERFPAAIVRTAWMRML